jgi:hypothetical protein
VNPKGSVVEVFKHFATNAAVDFGVQGVLVNDAVTGHYSVKDIINMNLLI